MPRLRCEVSFRKGANGLYRLTTVGRAALVRTYIETSDAVTQRRAQYLLLLNDDHPFEYVVAITCSEASEVLDTIQAFRDGGIDAITG
jgi:hypothetical protein